MRVSFVVPTRNSARTLEACLGSLRAQTYDDVEIVVVDNASTDGTAEIGERMADRFADRGPERSAQRNHGAFLSSGDVIVYIDSDMVLEPRVAAAIVAGFRVQPDVGALIIPEHSFGDGFFARCRILEKSLYVGDDGVEAPRAFRRPDIERVGGWNEALTAAEDWDLADRIRVAGVKVGRIDAWIWHDEGTIRLRSTFPKKRYYGRWIDAYRRSDAGRARTLYARPALLKQPAKLLRHPFLTAGMVVLKATEAAGLLAGIRDSRKEAAR
jgi:glycosyltransferase involved in cell wall biosynthesis